MTVTIIATVVMAFLGWLLAYTARQSVRPNVNRYKAPGVRTGATMISQEHWLSAHREVERPLYSTGMVLTGLSLVTAVAGIVAGPVGATVVALGVLLIPLPVWLFWLALRAHRAAQRVGAP